MYQCFHCAISIAQHIHFSKGFQLIFIFHLSAGNSCFLFTWYTRRKSAVYIPTCRITQRQYKLNSQLCNNKTLRWQPVLRYGIHCICWISASEERADTTRCCSAIIRDGCVKVKSNKATVSNCILSQWSSLHLLRCVIYNFIYSFKDTTPVVSLKV